MAVNFGAPNPYEPTLPTATSASNAFTTSANCALRGEKWLGDGGIDSSRTSNRSNPVQCRALRMSSPTSSVATLAGVKFNIRDGSFSTIEATITVSARTMTSRSRASFST